MNTMIDFFYSLLHGREHRETIRRRIDQAMKQARNASSLQPIV